MFLVEKLQFGSTKMKMIKRLKSTDTWISELSYSFFSIKGDVTHCTLSCSKVDGAVTHSSQQGLCRLKGKNHPLPFWALPLRGPHCPPPRLLHCSWGFHPPAHLPLYLCPPVYLWPPPSPGSDSSQAGRFPFLACFPATAPSKPGRKAGVSRDLLCEEMAGLTRGEWRG